MLRTRVLSALILGPIVLSAFYYGSFNFMIGWIIFLAGICVYESVGILVPGFERQIGGLDRKKANSKKHLFKIRLFCVAMMAWIILSHVYWPGTGDMGTLVFVLLLTFSAGILSADNVKLAAGRSFGMFLSVVYGTLPWVVIWDLYLRADHSSWILFVGAITWFNDIGGYFGGRFGGGKIFGERKLAKSISPKKTWEGAITGMILGVVAALLLNSQMDQMFGSTNIVLLMSILGGAFSIVGDLVESTMKRFSGIKDSGRIIPGHGGLLDRVDGIVFCAPMIWFICFYGDLLGI
jgi:phosphatidate cytidylyltransferase